MDDYSKLSASDGTGEAVVANIENTRAIAAVTLDVDNVDNWPTEFICVTGTLNPNNYIDNASMTIFYGHLDAGNIIIDSFAPGYTDVGNSIGQIAIIKPTTEWVNQVVELAMVAHQDNGKLKTTSLDEFYKPSDITSNFVFSGGIWTGDSYASTRNASMTALVCYINGIRGTVAAVTARAFTASRDTYVDVLNTAGVFSLVYTEVTNNAASPALADNSIRIAIVVTAAGSIAASTAIGQGGFANITPVISSQILKGFDSLGNLIYPKGPVSPHLTKNPYKFHVYRNAAQNNGSNTFVVLQCDTKLFDTGNNVDVTTNKGRFTAPVAGFYQFIGTVNAQLTGTGILGISLFKNGVRTIDGNWGNTTAYANAVNNGKQVNAMLQLAAGDYIEVQTYGNSAYALSVGNSYYCTFQGYLVSAS